MIDNERGFWDNFRWNSTKQDLKNAVNAVYGRITDCTITQSVYDPVRIDLSIEPYSTYIDTDIAATRAAFKNYILEGKKMPIRTGIDYELKGFTFVPVYKYEVKKIVHSGPCTIVFWEDNTKTVVRLEEGKDYDEYAAFTAALAKKCYGSNSQVHKILEKKTKRDLKEKIKRAKTSKPIDLFKEEN